MMPRGDRESEYTDICKGLERMAHIYKEKGNTTHKKSTNRISRLLPFIRRMGLKEALRRYGVQKSRVDSLLPVNDAGRDTPGGKRNYFCNDRIAVYTAEFGSYDEVQEPLIKPDNIDYYIITDDKLQTGSCWKQISPSECIPEEYRESPQRSNRWCKMHPHELFPEYRYSIYIDSNFLIVSDFTELVNRVGDYPIAMFRHKNRDCVYDEIEACMVKNKAPRDVLQAHGKMLREHGVPEKYGLLEAPVIVRRHMEPECIDLMDHWWRAFLKGSGRDQIALVDALWELQVSPSRLDKLGPSISLCDLFIRMPHRGDGNKTR